MDKSMKGLLIFLVVILTLGLGYYFFVSRNSSNVDDIATGHWPVDIVSRTEQSDTTSETESLSNYVDFSNEALQESMNNGKVVLLYFTANWCPTCRAQEPINISLFNNLQEDSEIIAYKAHILDDETTKEGEALAKEYGVRLQHSFVLLDPSGEVVFTHTGPLTEEDLMKELIEAKGNG